MHHKCITNARRDCRLILVTYGLFLRALQEKELKEARAKESQPFDIFSIAGVTLPTGNSGVSNTLNLTLRHDGQSASGNNVGSSKRPRRERPAQTGTEDSAVEGLIDSAAGSRPKLKRSSMAARADSTQGPVRRCFRYRRGPHRLSRTENVLLPTHASLISDLERND
jgi:hypothetical protein